MKLSKKEAYEIQRGEFCYRHYKDVYRKRYPISSKGTELVLIEKQRLSDIAQEYELSTKFISAICYYINKYVIACLDRPDIISLVCGTKNLLLNRSPRGQKKRGATNHSTVDIR